MAPPTAQTNSQAFCQARLDKTSDMWIPAATTQVLSSSSNSYQTLLFLHLYSTFSSTLEFPKKHIRKSSRNISPGPFVLTGFSFLVFSHLSLLHNKAPKGEHS